MVALPVVENGDLGIFLTIGRGVWWRILTALLQDVKLFCACLPWWNWLYHVVINFSISRASSARDNRTSDCNYTPKV